MIISTTDGIYVNCGEFPCFNQFVKLRIDDVLFYRQKFGRTVFITKNNEAYGIGYNKYGGLGGFKNVGTLKKLPVKNVKDVAISERHIVLLTHDGDVYGCGDARYQLGNPYKCKHPGKGYDYKYCNCRYPIKEFVKLKIDNVDFVRCSSKVTLFVTNDGDVYAYGRGLRTVGLDGVPTYGKIKKLPIQNVTDIILTECATIYVVNDKFYVYGKLIGKYHGYYSYLIDCPKYFDEDYDHRVLNPREHNKIDIDVKSCHTSPNGKYVICLTHDGDSYCIGEYSNILYHYDKPYKMDISDVKKVFVEDRYIIYVTSNGTYMFETYDKDFMFDNSECMYTIPPTKKLIDLDVLNVYTNKSNVIFYTTGGFYGFGENLNGELGLGHYNRVNKITKLRFDKVDMPLQQIETSNNRFKKTKSARN